MSCKSRPDAGYVKTHNPDYGGLTGGMQVRVRMSRRHQPDVVTDVRYDQHLRGLLAAAPALSQPHRSPERRGRGPPHQGAQELRRQGQGYARHDLARCARAVLTSRTEYVRKYATKEAADDAGAESEDDDDMSSVASFGDDDDDEPAGQMDDV